MSSYAVTTAQARFRTAILPMVLLPRLRLSLLVVGTSKILFPNDRHFHYDEKSVFIFKLQETNVSPAKVYIPVIIINDRPLSSEKNVSSMQYKLLTL